MPRSFLVKKIKGDGFQCSGVPAPTYHPLETAYVLPGARGPPGDNGEWDPAAWGWGNGRDGGVRVLPNSGYKEGCAPRGTPGRDFPCSVRLWGFQRTGAGGAGARSVQRESRRVGPSPRHAPDRTLKVVALEGARVRGGERKERKGRP